MNVARNTNDYFLLQTDTTVRFPQHIRWKWTGVRPEYIKALIAVEIAMGMCRKHSIESYFRNNFWLTTTPGFSDVFSRNQYQLIRSCLHFNSNTNQVKKGQDGYDPLFKIRPIMDMTKDSYSDIFECGRDLSVDESMLKFKGRLSFKQYLPSKPSSKWGIKLWSLCDSRTGYLLKYNVYTGKCESHVAPLDGLSSQVVKELMSGLEHKGHVVYMD